MKPLAACLAAACVCALAGSALARPSADGQLREVSIPGKAFVPGSIDVLVGDTVVWRNGDTSTHTVTAQDDSFDSGFLSAGGTFEHTFSKTGTYRYSCTIHKFMRGSVRVSALALAGPSEPVLVGRRFVLHGLARPGTTAVVLERLMGATRETVATLKPAADGSFAVRLLAAAPTVLRASAGGDASVPVRVAVAPRVTLRTSGGAVVGTALPSRAGARAALQLYDRDHFAWRTVERGSVGPASTVRFSIPGERRGWVRIVVRGGDGWADGASRALSIRSG